MRIENKENYIELEIQIENDEALPSYGDALIGVVISSNGYKGQNQVWVLQKELVSFSKEVMELEKSRKGEAILKSISPGELLLKIYAYDNVGHLAVEGQTSHTIFEEVNFKHSIQFGFTIDPEQLIKLSKSKWVASNA